MPSYSPGRLTEWYKSELPMHNSRVLRYFADRAACVLDILDARELVAKTAYVPPHGLLIHADLPYSEFARVFGIDFFAVISRGSQYKVESFLFRIGKPENFIIMAPSRAAVRSFHTGRSVTNLISLFRLASKTRFTLYRSFLSHMRLSILARWSS